MSANRSMGACGTRLGDSLLKSLLSQALYIIKTTPIAFHQKTLTSYVRIICRNDFYRIRKTQATLLHHQIVSQSESVSSVFCE